MTQSESAVTFTEYGPEAEADLVEEDHATGSGSSLDLVQVSGLSALDEGATEETVEEPLRELVRLVAASAGDRGDFELVRSAAIRELRRVGLSAPARIVDGFLRPAVDRNEDEGRTVLFPVIESWEDPVDGALLFEELVSSLLKYVAMPRTAAIAVSAWVLHAFCHDAFQISPLLAITSPQKRCGKTTLMSVLESLVPKPLPSANITMAAVFRSIEAFLPTLLIDEADTFLHDKGELHGVLNSGHYRAMAKVTRIQGDEFDVAVFSTWGPKAIALIGKLPDTLQDRSIEIRLRRRMSDETVQRLRRDRVSDLHTLRRMAARWAEDNLDLIRAFDPRVPPNLGDRAADNWRPLLAIAQALGPDWTSTVRAAAVELSAEASSDASAAAMLLEDLRPLMEESARWHTKNLLSGLHEMEGRPWPEWRRGQPMTSRQLAKLLEPFGVKPKKVRIGDRTLQGYWAEDFSDAFVRYLPPTEAEHPEQPASVGHSEGEPPLGIQQNVPGEDPGAAVGAAPHVPDVLDVPDLETPF
ncbi:DUF3631 domain-containing protein [Gemmatimonadota bacterium]